MQDAVASRVQSPYVRIIAMRFALIVFALCSLPNMVAAQPDGWLEVPSRIVMNRRPISKGIERPPIDETRENACSIQRQQRLSYARRGEGVCG